MGLQTGTQSITPTLTLASIYEQQGQSLDALAVLEAIYRLNPTTELAERIELLGRKILRDNNYPYDPLIAQIFTTRERDYFKIVPHESYVNWQKAVANVAKPSTMVEEPEIQRDDIPEDVTVRVDTDLEKAIAEMDTVVPPTQNMEPPLPAENTLDPTPSTELIEEFADPSEILRKWEAQQQEPVPQSVMRTDMTLAEFTNSLIAHFGPQATLQDLRIGDILRILQTPNQDTNESE